MTEVVALGNAHLVSLQDLPIFRTTLPSKLQATFAAGRQPSSAALTGDAADVVRESGGGVVVTPGDPQGARGRDVAVRRPASRAASGPRTDRVADYYLQKFGEGASLHRMSCWSLLEQAALGTKPRWIDDCRSGCGRCVGLSRICLLLCARACWLSGDVRVRAPRLTTDDHRSARARPLLRNSPSSFTRGGRRCELRGITRRSSADYESLAAANAFLPGLIGAAAHQAGVTRYVHVSSAVVKGRCPTSGQYRLRRPVLAIRKKQGRVSWQREGRDLLQRPSIAQQVFTDPLGGSPTRSRRSLGRPWPLLHDRAPPTPHRRTSTTSPARS